MKLTSFHETVQITQPPVAKAKPSLEQRIQVSMRFPASKRELDKGRDHWMTPTTLYPLPSPHQHGAQKQPLTLPSISGPQVWLLDQGCSTEHQPLPS